MPKTTQPTALTSMRLPVELKTYLQHQAIDNSRSLPGEVIFRLNESRKRDEAAGKAGKKTPAT